MTIIQSIVLGIVQGLGEFLPISSSAHIVIVPWLFNWEDPGLSFDVALHLCTLFAVLFYFWKDWIRLIKSFFASLSERKIGDDVDRRLVWFILIASVPGAAIGYLFEKQAETIFRNPWLIAIMMIFMGGVLFYIDRKSSKKNPMSKITLVDSLIIGISQALAIIPGVSRSGATITAALWRNLDRESAARFSFLLSTPIIAGAGLLKIKAILNSGLDITSITGILFSTLFGFLSIKYLLKFVQTRSYDLFVYYRLIFGLIVLATLILRYN